MAFNRKRTDSSSRRTVSGGITLIKSMTGFGKGEVVTLVGNFTVEIRAVNHRYGEISVRLPRSLYVLENEVKRLAASILKRGKIEISVQWDEKNSENAAPQLDMVVARGYYAAYTRLSKELNLPQDAPLSLIMTQKGVMKEVAGIVDEGAIPVSYTHLTLPT